MVKTLPTIERSTKIRFGKNVQEDQGENTIVLNASNTVVDASDAGAVYITPVRNFRDYVGKPEVVLMMYNTLTKELTESGESAQDIIGNVGLDEVANQGNATSNTIIFNNNTTAIVTTGKVCIANSQPGHTLSIGSNVYIDDVGPSNVLVVNGGVSIEGNLAVNGGITTITTENLIIEDAIIEIGKNNTSEDTTLDLGLIMTRPGSNVTVGFKEVENEMVLAYTQSSAYSNTITPIVSEDLDVHVYGGVLTESNVGIKTTNPDAELHVVGNVYVSSNLTVDGDTLHVDAENDSVGINTKNPNANLHVVGNVYVSSNLTVDTDTFHVDVENKSVGIETKNPDANLHVVGNVYVSSNLTVDGDTLHVDVENKSVGIETKNPDANLHVVGNVYVSSNLTVDGDTLHVDVENKSVGIETVNPDANLHVVGNVYVSSNLTVDGDTLHVDAGGKSIGLGTVNPHANLHVVGNVYVSSDLTVDTDTLHVDAATDSVGIGTVNPTSNFHVAGNAYVSSNTTTDGTLTLNHPTTAILTDLTSNVEVKLNQLANVSINTTDVDESLRSDHVLVYDGVNWVNEYPAHNYIRFYNDSGATLYSGNCVYIVGHHNTNLVEVGLASATSADTMPSIGIVYNTSVAQGDQGVAVAYGKVNQMDTSGFLEGDTLYVSNVNAGLLSNVKPYGVDLDLIQNIGVCTRSHPTSGTIFVTGVGRSNDIPNARIVLDEGDINYVYVNDQNNDLKKIEPSNLLTQLQTLEQVSAAGNTTSNIMSFTNSTTSIVTSSNAIVGGNISIADLTDPQKKYLTMVNQDGFLQKSPVYVDKDTGVYVIEAAEAEFQGNLTLSGNTTILNSESVTISDRIFGVGANNSASQLDSGFMIEHQEGDPLEYANVALIYHADEHRFSISYTQNTFTDNHILHYEDEGHRMLIDLRGNVQIQNNTTIGETLDVTGATTIADDLTVGAASNLFVDVSSSRVGINEASPTVSLDVGGDARVQDTTDAVSTTTGALVVSGGIGAASNIHSTNVYAGSHVGVGTNAATAPLHILVSGTGETTNGIYMKSAAGSATNDAIVNLEVAADGGDAFMTWNASGGAAFAMGLDRSESLLTIANSSSDLTTNARLRMATDGAVTLTNATNATSKTTGALIVGGGIGVTGDIHATHANLEDVEADSVNVTDTTTSDSTTTGALRVAGGVSTQENLNVGGVTKVWDSTAVTGKTDGALVVVGGVGISGDIHATHANLEDVEADSVNVTDTTAAASTTTGALKVTGGVSTQEK